MIYGNETCQFGTIIFWVLVVVAMVSGKTPEVSELDGFSCDSCSMENGQHKFGCSNRPGKGLVLTAKEK